MTTEKEAHELATHIHMLILTQIGPDLGIIIRTPQEAPEVFASTCQREVKLPQETFVKRLHNTDTQFTIGAFESGQKVLEKKPSTKEISLRCIVNRNFGN